VTASVTAVVLTHRSAGSGVDAASVSFESPTGTPASSSNQTTEVTPTTPGSSTADAKTAAAKAAATLATTSTKAAATTTAATPSDAAMAGMPGMPMVAPKPGKWVSVDPVQQAKDTKAFFASKPDPITGNPVGVPEFNAQCDLKPHHGSNDPIVFPGQPGVSHNHTFLGNTSTNATSTLKSLLAHKASSCQPKQDHSAYWIPTLYVNNKTVDPVSTTVYYGSSLSNHAKVQPFPQGLRMVVGNATNQLRSGGVGHEFYCQGADHVLTAGGFPTCATSSKNQMLFDLVFPECWDGKHLDSPDHKSHMAYGIAGGKCDAAHPVQVPSLHFVIHYPGGLDVKHARLASGNAYSMHGDFFNAWEKPALAKRVRNCIDQSVKCNTAGKY
jgi:hypothetical protein